MEAFQSTTYFELLHYAIEQRDSRRIHQYNTGAFDEGKVSREDAGRINALAKELYVNTPATEAFQAAAEELDVWAAAHPFTR